MQTADADGEEPRLQADHEARRRKDRRGDGPRAKPRLAQHVRQGALLRCPEEGKKYVFDVAFDGQCDNREIYGKTVGNLVPGVLRGLNATVFSYGATGSGKTYTMVGSNMDPGLMVLSLRDIFEHIDRDTEKQIDVTCSYLEVYNEIIYDLLQPSAAQRGLDLREDPENGPQVAGLRRLNVHSAEKIFQLLREGNQRRRTESTDANAESSRSHAVLEIVVRRSDKNHYAKNVYTGKLALVDLAGAERAHETNNHGQQLRDGANINRSLLALANCINALGKRKKKGFVFVPFRNSKLTRLLKDGLCGNSRTIMIATCASADSQYSHTVNTLKYADRAKEIKTHVRIDKRTVDTHNAEYQRMIDALQQENRDLKMAVHAMTGTKWQGIQNIPEAAKASRPALEAAKTPQPKKPAKVEKDQKSEQKAAWMRRTSDSMKTLSLNRAKCQQELLDAHQRKIRHQIDADMIAQQIQMKLKSDEGSQDVQMLHQRKSDAANSLSDSNSSVAHLENTMSSYDAQLAILEAEIESNAASVERDAFRLQAVAGRRETENVFSRIDAKARNSIIVEQNSIIKCLWQILERHGVNQDMATETAWKAKIFPVSGSADDHKTFFQQYKSVNNGEQKEILKKALSGYKNDLETKQWSDLSSITASTTEKACKATACMAEAAVLVQATRNDPNPNPASRAARTNTLRSSQVESISNKPTGGRSQFMKENDRPPPAIQAFGSPSQSKENSNPKVLKSKRAANAKKGKDVSQIGNLKLQMRKRRQSISER